jgi:hypothetical protein
LSEFVCDFGVRTMVKYHAETIKLYLELDCVLMLLLLFLLKRWVRLCYVHEHT